MPDAGRDAITVVVGRFDGLVRHGLSEALRQNRNIDVLAMDIDGSALERAVSRLAPQVVIVAEVVEQALLVELKSNQPSLGILVLSAENPSLLCASYTNSSLYKSSNLPRSAASVIYGGSIPAPSAPGTSTGPASGVSEERVNLNGTVNPNATETHYYFQYGPTASYGNDAPALPGGSAGAGTSAIPVSTTITGLEEGATYHYRLVAESYWGTSYGSDQVVTTSGYPVTSFYAGSGDTLQENWWNGSSWGYVNITAPLSLGSSPATDLFPNIGQYDVYFRGSGGELQEDYYGGESGWHLIGLGHTMAAGTTPTVVHPRVGGTTYVFYVGSNGILQESWWNGAAWQWASLGATVEVGTSPAGL